MMKVLQVDHHVLRVFIIGVILCLGMPSPFLQAQSHREWVRSGNKLLQQGDYASAVQNYKEAAALKPDDIETQWLLGEAAKQARDYSVAATAYGVVGEKGRGTRQRSALLYQALMLKQSGDLDGWEAALKRFNENPNKVDDDILEHAASEWASIDKVRLIAAPDSVFWQVENAGSILNSDFAELRPWPMDDSLIVFGSSQIVGNLDADDPDAQLFRIFYSKQTLRGFEKPQVLDKRLNQEGFHTANPAISPDGNKLYFTVCDQDKGGPGLCEIWISERARGKWGKTRPMDSPINIRGYTATQPAPARHGTQDVLYFVSDRPGGSGGLDIWYSILTKGVPSTPINAGTPVNTPGDEVTPYYDEDKEGLFFSSDRHPGLGGWDIFFARGGLSKWEPPQNLGMKLNSPAEDFGFIPPSKTSKAMFASNRPGSRTLGEETCCFDIYLAEVFQRVPKEAPPTAKETMLINQAKASKINTVLPLSLYFDNDHPDPRSTSETTRLRYLNTLDAYIARMPEYITQYTKGLSAARSGQAKTDIEGFFNQEVLPARQKLHSLFETLLETLKEGRDVELVVQGYASPLNTPAYNKTLAARRIRSLINELQDWNGGALQPYLEAGQLNKTGLRISEVPIGAVEDGGRISSNPSDLRNAVYSPEAARARRISILYGKVEGMVGKTTTGITRIHFKEKIKVPSIPQDQHYLAILSFENTGVFPLGIDSVMTSDPRINTVLPDMLIAPGKQGEIYLKVDGPWDPEEDKFELRIFGNLPKGNVMYTE